MDVLARLFGGSLQASYGPTDDFWYGPAGGQMTPTGLKIDSESAQKVSAYFRGVDIHSTTLAMLPLPAYKRITDGGREPVSITVGDVVGRKPNVWQDSFQWRRQQMRHLLHWGNAYNKIVPGSRGFLDELRPIHPSLVTPEQLDSGRVIYRVRSKNGQTNTYTQDEIFHLRGLSDDGIVGKGVLEYARDSLGLALATEGYAGAIYGRGAMHGGVVSVAGLLDDAASERMADSIVKATAGPKNWHRPWVLEQGATWAANTMTPENAQMLLSRQFSINDIARWLGLPPHMLGDLERSTNNNIEHQGQEFVTYNLGPWLTLFESAINDQLIIQTDTYYVEFVRDALVRGDIAARWDAYMKAVTTGTFTRNEVRELENRNKLPGLDEPLDPTHLTGSAGGGSNNAPKRPAKANASVEDSETRVRAIVTESAARVQRKEIAAVQKAAVKHAQDNDAFAAWATTFYDEHVTLVMATMCIGVVTAQFYCDSQRDELISQGIAATECWTPDWLVGLAIDLPRPDPMYMLAKAAVDRPSAPIQVNAGIEKGAISVSSPVNAPITTAPITIHPANVSAPVTIADGAIRVLHNTTVEAPDSEPVAIDVTKTVTRGKDGIEKVHEEHRPVKKRKRDGGV